MYPEKNIIYDSRVAYSLYWILLSQGAGDLFFPIPSGRNSKMLAFDMNVLIRLFHVETYVPKNIQDMDNRKYITNKDKSLYIPDKQAYKALNRLIKEINDRLWEEEEKRDKLYYTEMLLFSIADREIFQDISQHIQLSIKSI